MKGYTVTADYAGTVSRINLNKIRYVAIFEGHLHLHGVQLQGQRPGKTVLGDKFLCLRQKGQGLCRRPA